MVERLIFFDIDGTLVPDTSTGSFIAKRLGSLEQMAAAERAYEGGASITARFARSMRPRGAVTAVPRSSRG